MDEKILARLAAYKKTAWLPKVVNDDGTAFDSKFSGTPWLGKDEKWPTCVSCRQPMQLFLQLNLEQSPPAIQQALGDMGLLQFFYCCSDDTAGHDESWEAFPTVPTRLLRIVEAETESTPYELSENTAFFPVQRIIEWEEVTEYPSYVECTEHLALEFTEEEKASLEEWDEVHPLTYEGEKLGGWAYWVQYPEYPQCPRCKTNMQHLFQIDSDKLLPHMWGDAGMGYISYCPNHPDEIAFLWQCY